MPLTLRTNQSVALTYTQLDGNFTYLEGKIDTNAANITTNTGNITKLIASASSAIYTASVVGTSITFTKGNGTTFGISIDVSNYSGFVTTSSFNRFTGSAVTTSSFNVFTSSVVTTSSFNNLTSSVITTGSISITQSITGSLVISGSTTITGSLKAANITGSLLGTSSWAENAVSSSYPIAVSGSTLYSVNPSSNVPSGDGLKNCILLGVQAGYQTQVNSIIFVGNQAGYQATNAYSSSFIGNHAGYQAVNAQDSVFIGSSAGEGATNAVISVIVGSEAGYQANINTGSVLIGQRSGYKSTDADYMVGVGAESGFSASYASQSVFVGLSSGYRSYYAHNSVFIGQGAGYQSEQANNSVFIGQKAGYTSTYASHSIYLGTEAGYNSDNSDYSILIGYKAGSNPETLGNPIKSNNIVIGTNITLEQGRRDSINIGGIIFGTGSYSDSTSQYPYSGSTNGRIGINVIRPRYNLEVSGTVGFSNIVTSSVSLTNVLMISSSGQVFLTASSAIGGGAIASSDRIYSGSVTASVNVGTGNIFTLTSASVDFLKVSSSKEIIYNNPYGRGINFQNEGDVFYFGPTGAKIFQDSNTPFRITNGTYQVLNITKESSGPSANQSSISWQTGGNANFMLSSSGQVIYSNQVDIIDTFAKISRGYAVVGESNQRFSSSIILKVDNKNNGYPGNGNTNTGIYVDLDNRGYSKYRAIHTTVGDVILCTTLGSGSVGIGLTNPSYSLHVAGTTYISASNNNTSSLTVYGSGSTNPVFVVQGSQGELFSVTDSLSGSLFSVNDISGLPTIEVFSDSTVLMGNYVAPALYTTVKSIANTGITKIYTFSTSSYDAVYVDYSIRSGSNARAGQLIAMWSGSSVNYSEVSASQFGSTTTQFQFGFNISASLMLLSGSATTNGWTVKTIIRSI